MEGGCTKTGVPDDKKIAVLTFWFVELALCLGGGIFLQRAPIRQISISLGGVIVRIIIERINFECLVCIIMYVSMYNSPWMLCKGLCRTPLGLCRTMVRLLSTPKSLIDSDCTPIGPLCFLLSWWT